MKRTNNLLCKDNLLSRKLVERNLETMKKYKVTSMSKLKSFSIPVINFYKPISRCFTNFKDFYE